MPRSATSRLVTRENGDPAPGSPALPKPWFGTTIWTLSRLAGLSSPRRSSEPCCCSPPRRRWQWRLAATRRAGIRPRAAGRPRSPRSLLEACGRRRGTIVLPSTPAAAPETGTGRRPTTLAVRAVGSMQPGRRCSDARSPPGRRRHRCASRGPGERRVAHRNPERRDRAIAPPVGRRDDLGVHCRSVVAADQVRPSGRSSRRSRRRARSGASRPRSWRRRSIWIDRAGVALPPPITSTWPPSSATAASCVGCRRFPCGESTPLRRAPRPRRSTSPPRRARPARRGRASRIAAPPPRG